MDELEITIPNNTIEEAQTKKLSLSDLTLDEICFDTQKPTEKKKSPSEEIEEIKEKIRQQIENYGDGSLAGDLLIQLKIDRARELIKEMDSLLEKRKEILKRAEALLKEVQEIDDTTEN